MRPLAQALPLRIPTPGARLNADLVIPVDARGIVLSQIMPSLQNEEVKAYLQKTLTAMQGHLSSLQKVQQQLGS